MSQLIKIASLSDWGLGDAGAVLAKYSSFGLKNGDYKRMQKVAGEKFADAARNLVIEAGLEPVYQAALASTESHGYNRNGDGYSAAMLDKCASTFVDYGRLYRGHNAKDPNKSYGIIKLAQYDPRMGVVHVIGGLFKDAETAKQFGGGNAADKELELLAKKGSYPVSQGSSIIGGDKCVICGKVSTNKKDYCLPKTAGGVCDLFGCRGGLGKIADDGRHQALDNPNGIFHDLSNVEFPADRQAAAYRISPDEFDKQASLHRFIDKQAGTIDLASMQKLAAVIQETSQAIEHLPSQTKTYADAAIKLAQVEGQIRYELASKQQDIIDAYTGLKQTDDVTLLAKHAASDIDSYAATAARMSANLGVCVCPMSFFKAAGLCDADVAAATSRAATLYMDLVTSPERMQSVCQKAAQDSVYLPLVATDYTVPSELTLNSHEVRRRSLQKVAEGESVSPITFSSPSLSVAASKALDKYATYSLRTLATLVVSNPQVATFAIAQSNVY